MSERDDAAGVGKGLSNEDEALTGSFYVGDAESYRERLALQVEEQNAQREISEATGITDGEAVAELAGLGIRVDTLTALTLIPLIDTAWADGEMDERERAAILEAATRSGIDAGSTAYRLLEIWTLEAPSEDLINAWAGYVRALAKQLGSDGLARLRRNILGRARVVAQVAGDALDQSPHVSEQEERCLARLEATFGS